MRYNSAMSFERRLLQWYEENKRSLPWREDSTPYHVYLSEIMLQQTQVNTVLPYYQRFITAYPTLQDLASAKEEEVLKLWEGLGYYSRGQNLLKASQIIVSDYQGKIPETKRELRALPGIGFYTANAILAIVYDQKEIAIDGNLLRIYSRLAEDEAILSSTKLNNKAIEYYQEKLNETSPSSFNQALMDLGELVCLPNGLPRCKECPLNKDCLAFKNNTMLSYPRKKDKKARNVEDKTVFLLCYQDKVAIRKRESQGLLGSLYEFLTFPASYTKGEAQRLLYKRGYKVNSIEPFGDATFAFSHLVWNMTGYLVMLDRPTNEEGLLFVTREELQKGYPFPSAYKSYLTRYLALKN